MFKKLLLIVLFLVPISSSGRTFEIPASCSADYTQCIVDIFRQVARFRRPSLGEAEIREAIIEFAQRMTSRHWDSRGGVRIDVDRTGNLLVSLPGTGRFAGKPMPPLAVQAHLDMVEKVLGVEGDVSAFFQNGVRVVEENGILHSEGFQTTVGLDNGLAVAMMLLLMMDPTLEHPPLDLYYTISEEKNGMVGAKNLHLPISAEVLLNLDQEEDSTLCYGGMGSQRRKVTGPLPFVSSAGLAGLEVRLGGFEAVHSGAHLHEPRANPLRVAGTLLKEVLQVSPGSRLVSMEAGDLENLNTTPGYCNLKLAVPPADLDEVSEVLKNESRKYFERFPMGAPLSQIELSRLQIGFHQSLEGRDTERVANALATCPNNTLVRNQNPSYPFGLMAGSSLGYAKIGEGHATIAYMARGYKQSALDRASERVADALKKIWKNPESSTVETIASTLAWEGDPKSWLMELLLKTNPGVKPVRAQGGLEAGVLAQRFPQLIAAAFGASILNAHQPTEQVSRQSITQMWALLLNSLSVLGDFNLSGLSCADFLIQRASRT